MSKDNFKKTFSRYETEIQECIVSAWNDYHKFFASVKHLLSPTSRASIVFDFIVNNIKQRFDGRRNVRVSKSRRIFLLNIEEKILLRFKKLRNNKASCVRTQQTLDFFRQVELPDIPSPKRYIVGYQLNKIQTEIKAISVVCPQSIDNHFWAYDLEPIMPQVIQAPVSLSEHEQRVIPNSEPLFEKKGNIDE